MKPARKRSSPRFHIAISLAVLFGAVLCGAAAPEIAPSGNARRIVPNRTLPDVAQAKTGLEFSANPTTQEIFRARVFEEPLVPIGGEPTLDENVRLAAALLGYAKRNGPDDFSSLTDFLQNHPESPWRAALLTALGLEYYNTAYYSRALAAWQQAWTHAKDSTDAKGKALADRVAGELASMYARLGRMTELEALLKSFEGRVFVGSATEKIAGSREGLWNMQNRPEISFRCGPLALHRIKMATDPQPAAAMTIFESASTQQGFSLSLVSELSKKIGLNYQMAFREKGADFVVPSVLHWKVNHYAAIVRQEGDRYLLQDPTFRNDVWATRQALEEETSGYFAIPSGALPKGWRKVERQEGDTIWGQGIPSGKDDKDGGPDDPKTGPGDCRGMAVSGVHLMLVSLNLTDEPVGYSPPVGPPVKFVVRYNQRDAYQPATFTYPNFGPKWTTDWISYITDNPQSPLADVNYYIRGGGTRTFTGFNTNTQTYAFEQNDQTRLTRLGPANYEMTAGDGSKLVFTRSNGSIGTSRKVFLTQIVDPFGNAVTLNYDGSLRLTNITDAIGQATTLSYSNAADLYKITRVTDPFGRFASFDYDSLGRLTNITDVIGLNSQFRYEANSDFVNALITPYGTNTFIRGEAGTARWLETHYPDGSRDRVEFNQNTNGIAFSNPSARVPQGMATYNQWLHGRNTFYWSRTACATAYGDYSKAKLYHWLHETDLTVCSGILESTKEALEERVWYDYPGQSSAAFVGSTDQPRHVGRVLDDGTTQLYTQSYNEFGHLTNSIDPLGRTFSYVYSTNGIDLLEVRMTRAGKNELLSRTTYNAQHLPLTTVDAAGQTYTYTYNARGQLLTETNPKNETIIYTYNTNGYLIAADGALPGTNDVITTTYDALGRIRTKTDESGYTVTVDYDALDRITRITYPDTTFDQITYHRLETSVLQDRAGRQTLFEYNPMGEMSKRTDPLGRETQFQWCRCGDIKSLTDPMGRTTSWHTDVQGRLSAKEYGDGSSVTYKYEGATSRLREIIDEKGQRTQFAYNRDDTVRSKSYANALVTTPAVTYSYDPDHLRPVSMTDGRGTTFYSYVPITPSPALGAGQLSAVEGPLPNDTITYSYDELGRTISTAINGVDSTTTYDAAGRVTARTNVLGAFTYSYDGSSDRLLSEVFPNGQTSTRAYAGSLQDHTLQQITHQVGPTPVSEFVYGRNVAADRITTWSQKFGVQTPNLYSFGYDAADQLLSAAVTNAGSPINHFAYSYDLAGNRLLEQVGASNYPATFNALNQFSTSAAPTAWHTNEWDAEDRLVAVNAGNKRTEFNYDGEGRLASIRQLTNGAEVSLRRFVKCDDRVCEERDATGTVTKRFFPQGMRVENGPLAGNYYYTRDHLGSIRELTDTNGTVRARYGYDPFGRRTLMAGDVESDFGFAGMFWVAEPGLALTRFRAYDPALGRWLSRDPLEDAETKEGPNLYAYVESNPVNMVDPLGLSEQKCCQSEKKLLDLARELIESRCQQYKAEAELECAKKGEGRDCTSARQWSNIQCSSGKGTLPQVFDFYIECLERGCKPNKDQCQKSGRKKPTSKPKK